MSWSRKRSENRFCKVLGCPESFYAKEMCKRHYYRAKANNGDPLASKQKKGSDRYDAEGNRWCSRCKTYLHEDEFSSANKWWCRVCNRLARYKLTRESFALLPGANGICPICGVREATEIDHDHECCGTRDTCGKCVRGVLCRPCNTALGTITEKGLKRAMNYVKKRHGGKAL